ncbi:hypothetical protein TNCV_2196091 [Trichonephila clavipes]|nr:hypothetical protein TNCV_2196091 [Trichonephila clavipes]
MHINGNENVDLLATRGTLEPQDNKPLPPESLKKHIFEKLVDTFESGQAAKSTSKSWANIQGTWVKFYPKLHKKGSAKL